jgi:hypothetical protein
MSDEAASKLTASGGWCTPSELAYVFERPTRTRTPEEVRAGKEAYDAEVAKPYLQPHQAVDALKELRNDLLADPDSAPYADQLGEIIEQLWRYSEYHDWD